MAENDFYVKMLSDLPSQFKNKEKIDGLIYALSRQLNAVREVYSQLNDMRSLRTAVGKQLDGIGNIAVLTRDEATVLALKSSTFVKMTDDIYRLYLIQKFMANMTNCTYQDIYNAMVILWGKTPIWYSESIDEPATITLTVPALSSFDEASTFLGIWEIRPAGVRLHFTATANEKIAINADFRPSAFIITHIKTGTKPRWAIILTLDGLVVDEALFPKVFKERHEQTGENLHSGTNPIRIIFLDKDGAVIKIGTAGSAFIQNFDRAGTKPRDAVIIGSEQININEHSKANLYTAEPPQTSEELHSGTEPMQIVFLDEGGAVFNAEISGEAYKQTFDRAGTSPGDAVIIGSQQITLDEQGETSRFIINPPQTSEELHSGTNPARIVFTDEAAAKISQSLASQAFGVEYERSGKEPSNVLLVDLEAVGVSQILEKEVMEVGFEHTGTEPQSSVLGSDGAAGVTTEVNLAAYSVKYRKCGTGTTKS